VRASAAEFVLEGLYAHRRISRTEAFEFQAGERRREPQEDTQQQARKAARRQFQ
jgi:magnesium chelatase subunit I